MSGVAVVPPAPGTPIPSTVEFRVPKPPTVAVSDSGPFVAYELHVTNLTSGGMALRRVEVFDAQKNAVLSTLADSALLRAVARAGAPVAAAERLQIGGGLRAYVYLWVPVDRTTPPSRVRHRLTFKKLSGDSAVEVLEGAEVVGSPGTELEFAL